MKIRLEDEKGIEHEVPTKFVLCSRCQGFGKHDHPAFANGITSSEWNSPDWDDESREAYICGAYDVQCSVCKGLRVVAVPDVARCTFTIKRLLVQRRRAARELAADYHSERYMRQMEGGY